MAYIEFNGTGISAMAACVPPKILATEDLGYLLSNEEIAKTLDNVGIRQRRIAEPDVCSSDLCCKAAQKLISDNGVDVADIKALIFVSQTSDYHQPATAPILQHRLGLGRDTLSFDINLACSGFVYGLSAAYAYAAAGAGKVLLLVGETMSKIVSPQDKESLPLFGDAGTATLIECGDFGKAVFSLHSDGSGADIMMVPYGGFRNRACPEAFENVPDGNGSVRNGYNFKMDGLEVFNFGMRVEPKDLKELMARCGVGPEELDLVIYHQANKFLTDFFTRRLKIDPSKTPYSLDRFGNTSSASIPLTVVSELGTQYPSRSRVILSGFGAGLSWGSVYLDLSKCRISELIEY